MMNFYTPITNIEAIAGPHPLWQLAESYLHYSSKTHQVKSVSSNQITLEESLKQQNIILKIVKLAFSIIFILPLAALFIQKFYRQKYQFNFLTPLKQTEHGVNPQSLTAYKIETVLEQIKQAKAAGLKVGLFVARREDQTIPQEKGWLWLSLDEQMNQPFNPLRPHLKIDFNNRDQMQTINQLFNKVVVDLSVIKFFNRDKNPWEELRKLLIRHRSSKLITEKDCGVNGITNEESYKPEKGQYNASIKEYNKNKGNIDWEEKTRLLLAKMGAYFSTLFTEVTLKEENYPYLDNEVKTQFWVLGHPKQISSVDRIEIIKKQIDQAKAKGQKVGLLIGRNDHQPLPQHKDWLWISLDCNQMKKEFDPQRPHLKMNFNNKEKMAKISYLFNKVITDLSFIKSFDRPIWSELKQLLIKEEEAELITESWKGISYQNQNQEIKYMPENGTYLFSSQVEIEHEKIIEAILAFSTKIGKQAFNEVKEKFEKNNLENNKDLPFIEYLLEKNYIDLPDYGKASNEQKDTLLEKIREHLSTLFEHVELKEDVYPLLDKQVNTKFWILRHPKKIID